MSHETGTVPPSAGRATSPDHGRPRSAALLLAILSLHRDDRASAAVSFILAFPIFLWILAVIVQFAILVNAKVAINHAANLAARSAVTSLPEDHPEKIVQAARLSLTALSPSAAGAAAGEAEDVYQSLDRLGLQPPASFPARYTYAMDATEVTWSPDNSAVNWPGSYARPVDVTVTYQLQLTVPGTAKLIGYSGSVGGIDGRFFSITSTARVMTSHSRQAGTDGDGLPQ